MFRPQWFIGVVLLVALVGCSQTGGSRVGGSSTLSTLSKETPSPQSQDVQVASGGLVEQLDLQTLTRQADAVVLGKVTKVASRWTDGQSAIVTEVTISVEQFVVPISLAQDEIVVVVAGGTVGEVTQSAEDEPQFGTGERVLLFLSAASDGTYKVTGGWQGKQAIEGELVQAWDKSLTEAVEEIRALKSP